MRALGFVEVCKVERSKKTEEEEEEDRRRGERERKRERKREREKERERERKKCVLINTLKPEAGCNIDWTHLELFVCPAQDLLPLHPHQFQYTIPP